MPHSQSLFHIEAGGTSSFVLHVANNCLLIELAGANVTTIQRFIKYCFLYYRTSCIWSCLKPLEVYFGLTSLASLIISFNLRSASFDLHLMKNPKIIIYNWLKLLVYNLLTNSHQVHFEL